MKQTRKIKKRETIRCEIHQLATLAFKGSNLKVTQNLCDDVAADVITRNEFEYDTVAAEGKYHNNE